MSDPAENTTHMTPAPEAPTLALASVHQPRRGLRDRFRRRRASAVAPTGNPNPVPLTLAPEPEPEKIPVPAPRGYVPEPAAPDVTDHAERTSMWTSRDAAAAAKKGLEAQNLWSNARKSLETKLPQEHALTQALRTLRRDEAELRTESARLKAESEAAEREEKAALRSQARSYLHAADANRSEAITVERDRNELTMEIDLLPQKVFDELQVVIRYFFYEHELDAASDPERLGVFRTTLAQGDHSELDFEQQFRKLQIPLRHEVEAMIAERRRRLDELSEGSQ
jgi:hypothetical protein